MIEQTLAAREPKALAWLAGLPAPAADSLDPSGGLRLWLGLERFNRGALGDAVALFAGAQPALGAPYADLMRVLALDGIDSLRAEQAAVVLLSERPGHRFAGSFALLAARDALRRGAPEAADSILCRWPADIQEDREAAAANATLLAEAHAKRGRGPEFERAFTLGVERAAGGRRYAPLRVRQADRLMKSSDPLGAKTMRAVIDAYGEAGQFAAALLAWRRFAARMDAGEREAAARRLLQALRATRRWADIRSVAEDLEASGKRSEAMLGALWVGRSWRGEDPSAMAEAYGRAAGRGVDSALLSIQECEDAATALWELGREHEDAAQWDKAEACFREILDRFPRDERTRDCGLRVALCRERTGDLSFARSELARMCAGAEANQTAGPCLWQALLSEPDARTSLLARAAAESNPGYFARRAAWALAWESAVGGADSLFWPALTEGARDPATWAWPAASPVLDASRAESLLAMIEGQPPARMGRLMLSLGRLAWAREFWALLPGWDGLGPVGQAALLRALGDPGESIRVGIRTGDPAARYPVGYGPEILAAAERFHLSPALILAVIRQESLFESTVTSSAGARGLMQLMPETARRLADSLGWTGYDLTRAQDNILLGCCHLEELLSATGGELPVALAAYNGGLAAARRWRGRARNLDEFVEMIGYNETRRFVKSVLMHYGFFLEVYPAD
ncbi:MAG: lytic transglycosylase domain-containing protein [Candidatus Eisenbacteria bacterium]